MKRLLAFVFLISMCLSVVISGCAPTEETQPQTQTQQPLTATETPEPSYTPTDLPSATPTFTPTPLPGDLVLPLDSFQEGIPWLPFDESRIPITYFILFNLTKPPFDNPLVRQAFAAAVDKDVIIEYTKKYNASIVADPEPATSFIPPEVLGRDLYNDVGISYDPEKAKDLLSQAGYSDPSTFPEVTLLVNVSNDAAKGIHLVGAEKMSEMWLEHLGVEVSIEIILWEKFRERITENPPEMIRLGWSADYQDPNNFLDDLFGLNSGRNYGGYSNTDFHDLVQQGIEVSDPEERQIIYINAERILCETDPAVIPIFHGIYIKK